MVEAFVMSDISPVSGLMTDRVELAVDRPGVRASAAAPARTERPSDRVDISDRARYLSKLASLPDVRTDLVERIRREIASGTYETDEKLDAAVRNMAEDLQAHG
jgi:negative regulator of flagellin synthesis FlgM